MAQLAAILFSGTVIYDFNHETDKPHVFGVEIIQTSMPVFLLVLIATAFYHERRVLLSAS